MLGEKNLYDVKIVITHITDKGTEKKTNEHHLVYGRDYNDIQTKVKKTMSYCPDEWTIKQIKESDISDIYGKDDESENNA